MQKKLITRVLIMLNYHPLQGPKLRPSNIILQRNIRILVKILVSPISAISNSYSNSICTIKKAKNPTQFFKKVDSRKLRYSRKMLKLSQFKYHKGSIKFNKNMKVTQLVLHQSDIRLKQEPIKIKRVHSESSTIIMDRN